MSGHRFTSIIAATLAYAKAMDHELPAGTGVNPTSVAEIKLMLEAVHNMHRDLAAFHDTLHISEIALEMVDQGIPEAVAIKAAPAVWRKLQDGDDDGLVEVGNEPDEEAHHRPSIGFVTTADEARAVLASAAMPDKSKLN